jgi:IS605 OrfB family transposase
MYKRIIYIYDMFCLSKKPHDCQYTLVRNKTMVYHVWLNDEQLVRLSNEVKFVLQMQSHYSFKQYLKTKAKEYGTKVYNINESYTSQACTNCGRLSKEYENRIKICTCGKKIDRDLNGSRNILMKGLRVMYKKT